MRILITRHGETDANREGVIQGHLDTRLSELGKEQARKLAERLRDEKIDLIVSSDLSRAADTAREVARFHDCEVVFDERLRDLFMGDIQGKKKSDLNPDDYDSIEDMFLKNGAEGFSNIFDRAGKFLDYVLNSGFENVLLVGHGAINRNILGHILNCEHKDTPVLDNTSLCVFDVDEDGNFSEVLLNCVRHLE